MVTTSRLGAGEARRAGPYPTPQRFALRISTDIRKEMLRKLRQSLRDTSTRLLVIGEESIYILAGWRPLGCMLVGEATIGVITHRIVGLSALSP